MPNPSTPALLLAIVRFFTPLRRTAAIRCSGIPHNPNPPIKIVAPSRNSPIAASAPLTRLSMNRRSAPNSLPQQGPCRGGLQPAAPFLGAAPFVFKGTGFGLVAPGGAAVYAACQRLWLAEPGILWGYPPGKVLHPAPFLLPTLPDRWLGHLLAGVASFARFKSKCACSSWPPSRWNVQSSVW